MAKETKQKEAFPLKIEKEVFDKIRSLASDQNRSVNNYIETLLKKHVADEALYKV